MPSLYIAEGVGGLPLFGGTLVPPVFDERPVLGRLRRPEPEIAWCSTTIDVIEAYHQFARTSSTALAPRFSEPGGLANLLESMGPGWRSSGYALASDELTRQLGKRWAAIRNIFHADRRSRSGLGIRVTVRTLHAFLRAADV